MRIARMALQELNSKRKIAKQAHYPLNELLMLIKLRIVDDDV